jgi:hypothetical protein
MVFGDGPVMKLVIFGPQPFMPMTGSAPRAGWNDHCWGNWWFKSIASSADGSVHSVRDTMFPIRDQNERVKWVGGIAQDITIHDGLQAYLIDADPTFRQKPEVFYGAGYAVKTFASGADFLEMAHVLSTGCVVLYIQSAPSDGLELLTIAAPIEGIPAGSA